MARSVVLIPTLCLVLTSLFGACGAGTAPPAASPDTDEASVAEEAERQQQSEGTDEAAPQKQEPAQAAGESPKQAKTEQEEDDACPPEMVLVEGMYCTHESNDAKPNEYGNTPGAGAKDIKAIEHVCEKEWFAPQNKKRVCEEFAESAKCKGKKVKKRFCIDRHAWPNVKGHKPEVMNRFHQAQIKCAAVGKRLCTESEWTFACEGPEMKPFPYGYVRDSDKCHGDESWDSPDMNKVAQRDPEELRRLYKGKPAGQPQCVSDFGVYDLPANTDEVVASETFESGWRGKYDSVHTGGPWYKGVRNQCRPKIYTHDEGFYYYFLSFRCCAAPEGHPTEPLTPKQKKKGWDMSRVERIAGITVEEMRELLEKKKTDPTCGCKTTKCRTYCGTLHGKDWNPPLGDKAGNGMKSKPKKQGEQGKDPAKK